MFSTFVILNVHNLGMKLNLKDMKTKMMGCWKLLEQFFEQKKIFTHLLLCLSVCAFETHVSGTAIIKKLVLSRTEDNKCCKRIRK